MISVSRVCEDLEIEGSRIELANPHFDGSHHVVTPHGVYPAAEWFYERYCEEFGEEYTEHRAGTIDFAEVRIEQTNRVLWANRRVA